MASFPTHPTYTTILIVSVVAEMRGPGKRGGFSDDSPDEFDDDDENRVQVIRTAIRGGRIIMLGDGTEVSTDSDATFDDEELNNEKDDEALAKTPKESKSEDVEMGDASQSVTSSNPATKNAASESATTTTTPNKEGDESVQLKKEGTVS
jgi:protein phosphatase 2C family protein 2/3